MISNDRPGKTVAILGPTKTRKTTLMREVVRRTAHNDNRLRFFIWDTGKVSQQWVTGHVDKEGNYVPAPGTLGLSDTYVYRDLDTARELCSDPEHIVAYPFHVFQDKIDFNEWLEFVHTLAGIVIVCDEIDRQGVTKHNMPEVIEDIVNNGRHNEGLHNQRGQSLIWAARRFQKVHNDLLSTIATGSLFLTRTTSGTDIGKIQEEVGCEGLEDRIRSLDKDNNEFLRLEDGDFFEGPEVALLVVEGLTPFIYKQKTNQDPSTMKGSIEDSKDLEVEPQDAATSEEQEE